jgi:predicted acetyltransferase
MNLVELAPEHSLAFLSMIADYQERDSQTFERFYQRARPWTAFEFSAFVKECEKERQDWRPKAGKVSRTRYVLLDAEAKTILGNSELRFPLTDELDDSGGNLIFDVPPSQRGHNYGAITLNRMLFESVRAGMARLLITCAADNTHARRAIEINRGELDAEISGRARYWIRLR